MTTVTPYAIGVGRSGFDHPSRSTPRRGRRCSPALAGLRCSGALTMWSFGAAPRARTHTHTHACMHAQTNSPFPFPLKTLKGEDTHRTHL